MKIYVVRLSNGEYYNKTGYTVNKKLADILTYTEAENIVQEIKRQFNIDCIIECK